MKIKSTFNDNFYYTDNNTSEEYIEIYSNDENNILLNESYNFIYKLDDSQIYTKAIDLWKYYKMITDKKYRIKQYQFYEKISLLYGMPITKCGVKCFSGIIIKIN